MSERACRRLQFIAFISAAGGGGGRRDGWGRRAGGRGRRERDAPKRCFPLAFFPILCHPPAPCEGAVLARERVPPLIGRGFRESSASVVLGFIFPNWSLVYALTVNFDFAQHADILTGEFNSSRGVKLRQSGLLPDLRFSRELSKRRRAWGGEATSVGGDSEPPARAAGSRRPRRYVQRARAMRVSQLSGDDRAFERPRSGITFLNSLPFARSTFALTFDPTSTPRRCPSGRSCARRASAAPSAIAARSSTRRIARTRRRARDSSGP